MEDFDEQLLSIFRRQRPRQHFSRRLCVSNKEPSKDEFVALQLAISEIGSTMSSWGEELPFRWIHLETALDGERNAGINILSLNDVFKLAQDKSLHTSNNKDIFLFLRYQHECGHVIFFEDLKDYIILNPRWLIEAFKCLVSNQLKSTLGHLEDWTNLLEKGELTDMLISEMFIKDEKNLKFVENKEHLLLVLEKFDIIVKLKNEDKKSYFMPYVIKPSTFEDMCMLYGVESYYRTSWLLLEFEFLPPAFFNHVLVGYIRKFDISIDKDGNCSLYRGIGMFEMDATRCKKLVICASKNLIALQIWIYKNQFDKEFHGHRETLTDMVDELSKRYKICCKYKVKMICSKSDYQEAKDSFEYKPQDHTIYLCNKHQDTHKHSDVYKYWFSDEVSYTCSY